jgi:hypothetical protein
MSACVTDRSGCSRVIINPSENVLLMSCQGKLHVQPGHAPITRTMSQTSVNEDADLASDVAISPSKTKKRASRPAPEPEPPKRRAKRQRYAGEDMAILTVRIPERERALCYADATETIRTINAHVIHRLKHLVAKKGGVVRGQDVHSFIEAHGQGLGQRFVIRLPVSLQEEVKKLWQSAPTPRSMLLSDMRCSSIRRPRPTCFRIEFGCIVDRLLSYSKRIQRGERSTAHTVARPLKPTALSACRLSRWPGWNVRPTCWIAVSMGS